MGVFKMKMGDNIGELLLNISQEHILAGEPEKAIETYIESLQGFTKEYAIGILNNQYVLEVSEENGMINLVEDANKRAINAKNIYNWNRIINREHEELIELNKSITDIEKEFDKICKHAAIYDINLIDLGRNGKCSAVANIVAKMIVGKKFSPKASNGESVWCELEDSVFNGYATKEEQELYYIVKYNWLIRQLLEDFVSFDKKYNFLYSNNMCDRIPYIEFYSEFFIKRLERFADTSCGYYHPMCNVEHYTFQNEVIDELCKTKFGSEYLKYGAIVKSIDDRYDAAWISPEGQLYGFLGETRDMMHMMFAEQLYNHPNSPIGSIINEKVEKYKENDRFKIGTTPERILEHLGWLKVHDNEVHGSYSEWSDEFAYCPTDEQITTLCEYIKNHYNGIMYTELRVINPSAEPISIYKVKQMDKFALNKLFGL